MITAKEAKKQTEEEIKGANEAFQKAIDAEIKKTEKEIKEAIKEHKFTITHSDSFISENRREDRRYREAFIAELRGAGFEVVETAVGHGFPAQIISWDKAE